MPGPEACTCRTFTTRESTATKYALVRNKHTHYSQWTAMPCFTQFPEVQWCKDILIMGLRNMVSFVWRPTQQTIYNNEPLIYIYIYTVHHKCSANKSGFNTCNLTDHCNWQETIHRNCGLDQQQYIQSLHFINTIHGLSNKICSWPAGCLMLSGRWKSFFRKVQQMTMVLPELHPGNNSLFWVFDLFPSQYQLVQSEALNTRQTGLEIAKRDMQHILCKHMLVMQICTWAFA